MDRESGSNSMDRIIHGGVKARGHAVRFGLYGSGARKLVQLVVEIQKEGTHMIWSKG